MSDTVFYWFLFETAATRAHEQIAFREMYGFKWQFASDGFEISDIGWPANSSFIHVSGAILVLSNCG